MNIVFFGTPEFVIPVALALKNNFHLVAVVTTPDKPVGRKQIITPTPVKQWAIEDGIRVFQPENFDNTFIQELKKLQSDLIIVAAYGKIIPQQVLDIPTYGAINIHPSRLPEFRGPTPIQTAMLQDKDTAITFIKMDAEMDHGPIIHTLFFPIHSSFTFIDAATFGFKLAADALPEIIRNYTTGAIEPGEQDHSQATYTKIITKQDGYINLDNPPSPEHFDHMIRAYFPWPNVWTKVHIKNQELRLKFLPDKQIQLEGKTPVDLETFYRGYPELKEKIQRLYSYPH